MAIAPRMARSESLDFVLRLGFGLLHDVPCEPGMVLQVVSTFGYVRETNYGRLFAICRAAMPTWTHWRARCQSCVADVAEPACRTR